MTPLRKSLAVAVLGLGLVAGLTGALASTALETTLSKASDVRADKLGTAAVLQTLPTGAAVTLVSSEGGWALIAYSDPARKVRGKLTGWVRANALNWQAGVSAASTMASGREVVGNSALTLGVRSLPPRYSRHALIIGVSKYEDPAVPELPGVRYDRESATQIAQSMQVPEDNIRYLQDAQATGDAIRQALKDLTERVQEGDRVFIHFSGHGTRYLDAKVGGCVEGLLAYDKGWNGMITNREMASLLGGITQKTDKLFVMYDACHSGGVAQAAILERTRGLRSAGEEGTLQPKFFSADEECSRPVNAKSRGLVAETGSQGTLPQDIIHLSSARDNEISFDDSDKGGLATQYIRDCMLRDAVDLDHSGAISMEEIRQCAQAKINQRMAQYTQYAANNLVLTGNAEFVPAWFSQVALAPVRPAVPTTAARVEPPAAAPPVVAPVAPVPPEPVAMTGEQALRQMFAQRDAKRVMAVSLGKSALRIGADTLDFAVQSERAGYVYVALAGSDNQSVYVLFPNSLDQANRIEAGQTLELPRPNWRVKASGPQGTDSLLVVVADAPRDVSHLGTSRAGPFMMSLNNPQGRAELGALLSTSQAGASAACGSQGGSSPCSDAFAATLLQLKEVP